MIGGSGISTLFGAAPPVDSDTATLRRYIHALADAGLAVMFCTPGSKLPAEPRTARRIAEADKAYRAAEIEAGRRVSATAKAPAGLHLATTDKKLLDAYLYKLRGPRSLGGFTPDPDPMVPGPESSDGARTPAAAGKARKFTAAEGKAIAAASTVPINLAIEVGRSRVVVVDCDTADQVDAFLTDYTGGTESGVSPTVRSPGKFDATTGTWVHRDGGHFYFTVPADTVLPTNMSAFTAAGKYCVSWRDRYVLIPPSVRAEGAYVSVGREYPLESTMLAGHIRERAAARLARAEAAAAREVDGDLDARITAWAQATSWASILSPLGWVEHSTDTGCGCDTWTAPGVHDSPKSATAHDAGCTLGMYTTEAGADGGANAPLHVWTDNPGSPISEWIEQTGQTTITKLRVVALAEYGGDMNAALCGLGLSDPESMMSGEEIAAAAVVLDVVTETGGQSWDGLSPDLGLPAPPQPASSSPAEPIVEAVPIDATHRDQPPAAPIVEDTPTEDTPTEDTPVEDTPVEDTPVEDTPVEDDDGETDPLVLLADETFPFSIRPLRDWRHLEPPRWAVHGLIEQGGLVSIIGPSGVGKSFVVLDILAHLATGDAWMGREVIRQRTLYLPGEGMVGAVQRLKAWEDAHRSDVGEGILIGENILPISAPPAAWARLVAYAGRNQVGTIVIDTYARATAGADENSAKDTGIAIARLGALQRATGATVVLVHHTRKGDPADARGSSALRGAVDCELVIAPGWTAGNNPTDLSDATPADEDGPERGTALELRIGKMKNGSAVDSQVHMYLTPHGDNAVITDESGRVHGDDATVLDAAVWTPPLPPTPEHLPLLVMRIWDHLQDVSRVGATITELRDQVAMDEVTRRIASPVGARRQWRRRLTEALDLGLRAGAFGHPAGSSAKWVPVAVGERDANGTVVSVGPNVVNGVVRDAQRPDRATLEQHVDAMHAYRHDPVAATMAS